MGISWKSILHFIIYCIGSRYAGLAKRFEGIKNHEQVKIQPLYRDQFPHHPPTKKERTWIIVIPIHRMKLGEGYIIRVLSSERNQVDQILNKACRVI
jgi:hypothetical protein